ncbi:hypothetical protein [Rhodococcus sp. 06-1460-1B]|jgi:hypothetical protein|uniref:hypothetical protein n=1 Tax=Rhodococcus sp. 06-1460-1B TaxID=2022501 RepID=UPI000B9B1295|nr:hypothetical protein [Rhodococcus sp. 06-1460-1B]MBJ7349582.1 hypothetical protein [Rhodococcus sp. (in: high G+C Gram-positive bacteria)]OZD54566.1 hypothetical protein CH268_25355 [Rhodococcus sp. 06-1460-1B]RZL80541.1 MAG: hypothetical protein EOP29_03335 [Rhodococcus sp. (in: high G+C Gram-positive bacteria)]
MIVVPSIRTPLAGVVPSLSTADDRASSTRSSLPEAEMTVSVDESAGDDIEVRIAGTITDVDVPVLAETLGEAAERGRALILDLSRVTFVAAGVRSVLDATAIRQGRWQQKLSVVLPDGADPSGVSDRVFVYRTLAEARTETGARTDVTAQAADSR